ncbi:hypothetical protein LCGC14_1237170 [marine sediment metagenome]|uniref:Uncharacterized protein n=1 Tax=marine sediment metagenome TaxID=412755 RepID=A0A0F9L6Z2_9ZZZZ
MTETFKDFKRLKEPMLREISFEGNMPSSYEKRLRKDLAKSKR